MPVPIIDDGLNLITYESRGVIHTIPMDHQARAIEVGVVVAGAHTDLARRQGSPRT